MRNLSKGLLLLYILLMFNHPVFAQQYRYRSLIDTVRQTGFYKIIISPEISAHCKTDFSDIRIADSAGRFVPYITRKSYPFFYTLSFSEFPIIKNEITDSGKSLLIIENKLPEGVYKLSLLIKNTAVSRFASLSGSNDKEHWFIIDEKILIGESHEYTKDNYLQSLQFPVSAYKYFKLLINNEGTDPMNIEKVGIYTKSSSTNRAYNPFVQNPLPSFIQRDSSDGKSYIKVTNSADVQFDNIKIAINGPKFFSRKAEIFLPLNDSLVNRLSYNPIASIVLQPGADSMFDIDKQKAKLFYVVITNNDNPPLKIKGITTRQLQNEIVSYLEKGKQYSLLLDNPSASRPDYDLEKFRDSISVTIDSLAYGTIIENKKNIPVTIETKSNNKTWIWIIISLAGLLLTLFTFRLSTDINKVKK